MPQKYKFIPYRTNIKELIIKSGKTCTIYQKANSYIVESEKGKFKAINPNKSYEKHELAFISKVSGLARKYIKEKGPMLYPNERPLFFKFSPYIHQLPANKKINSINIDISAAYWTTLRHTGVITDEFYNIGLLPEYKAIRNIAIGALAAKTEKTTFINGVAGHTETTYPVTYSIQRYITSCIDRRIIELISDINLPFLFYWVDGIFFEAIDKQDYQMCLDIVALYNDYKFKVEKCNIIKTDTELCIIKPDEKKVYSMPKKT